MEITEQDVKEIAPYTDEEFRQGIQRLLQSPKLAGIVSVNFPKLQFEEFRRLVDSLHTPNDYQRHVILVTIQSLLKKTSSGLALSGTKVLSPKQNYLYLSNHRDIICDPALLCAGLLLQGFGTPKICLGDNLLMSQFIVDMVKTNKAITVKRNLSTRALFKWSQVLSTYIKQEIETGPDSIWLAQREGRAKDGNDLTHPGVIKMLALAGEETFLEKLAALHIVPMAVSYEYDPCDALKAREVYITATTGNYQKNPDEDVTSMMQGIRGFKGGIHISLAGEIDEALERVGKIELKKDQVTEIVRSIDRAIHQNYQNWPSNYIAYDLLEGGNAMQGHYSKEKKQEFMDRMQTQLDPFPLDQREGLSRYFLDIYANPVRNALRSI